MLITREIDYALRILRALSGGEQLTAADVCKRESIPQQFVYKILKKMERAGFVQIVRGAEGGCRLSADLEKISLFNLVESVEADRRISACTVSGYQCAWRESNAAACAIHRHLLQIQAVLDEELRKRTLRQMLFGDAQSLVLKS
ncbi:MAG: Rrf2 family transcriptional regulator [Synergistaceae bacterium]|jgi:Rrf2 family protein|nr:Rrf2 family transcriptional regulator [Synergistaceae bacterium]